MADQICIRHLCGLLSDFGHDQVWEFDFCVGRCQHQSSSVPHIVCIGIRERWVEKDFLIQIQIVFQHKLDRQLDYQRGIYSA